nr:STAS domain-containing protein [Desulfobulbaceae bacterium]
MEITTEASEQRLTVCISGQIDEKGAEAMKSSFSSLPLSGITEVQVDLKNLTYIGSSGIGKLLLFYKNLGVQQIRLRVTNVPPAIYELMQELKLDTVFTIERQ